MHATTKAIVRVAVIGSLAVTGVIHLVQPYFFLQTVAAYDVVPAPLLLAFTFLVPSFQVAVAFGMLTQYVGRLGVQCAFVIFLVFTAAQLSVLWRGLNVDCGCFGFHSAKISVASIIVPAMLSGGCMYLLKAERSPRRAEV